VCKARLEYDEGMSNRRVGDAATITRIFLETSVKYLLGSAIDKKRMLRVSVKILTTVRKSLKPADESCYDKTMSEDRLIRLLLLCVEDGR